MEGVTHPAFRALVAEGGGVGLLCTEFVRISRAPLAPTVLQRAVVKAPAHPLSVQVMGNDADKMAEAAHLVCEAGADVVDVNLGCPMPRVVRKGVGAAMLEDPSLLYDVLSAMRERTPALFSAKIRAGFDDAASAVTIARTVQAAGADFLTVHPRRRCDFYDGVADWRIIARIKEALDIPVVGNGDVWYAADVLRMERETGCDAVMIGRPALRNPWIFRQAAALREGRAPERPTGDDVLAHLGRVRAMYEASFSGRKRGAVGPLKELVRWIGRAVDDDRAFLGEALRAPDVDTILRAAERHLGGLGADRLDLWAEGHLGFERSGSADAGEEAA